MAQLVRRVHWIPATFVAGFVLVVAVNGALVWFATESFSGLDEEHAYESGLTYNQTLLEAEEVARLGWRADLSIEEAVDGHVIALRLSYKSGEPLTGLTIDGRLIRPTNVGLDTSVELREVSPGYYRSSVLANLPAGLWEARLVAIDTSPQWQMTQRLYLR